MDCETQPIAEIKLSTKLGKISKIRKSPAQVKILKLTYERNEDWNKDQIDALASQTGLSSKQVYKWYASERKSHQKGLPKGCSKR